MRHASHEKLALVERAAAMCCGKGVTLSPAIGLSSSRSSINTLRSRHRLFPLPLPPVSSLHHRAMSPGPRACVCLLVRNASSTRSSFRACATARGRLGDWATTASFHLYFYIWQTRGVQCRLDFCDRGVGVDLPTFARGALLIRAFT